MTEWREVTLGEVADVLRGVTYKPQDVTGQGTAVLRATNFNDSRLLVDAEVVRVTPDLVAPHQMLRRHDVLVTMSTGSSLAIGKSCVIEDDLEAAFGAFLGVIRPHGVDALPEWVDFICMSPGIRETWRGIARGTAIKNLRPSEMAKIPVPVPPLGEQRRIVDLMAAMDTEVEVLEAEAMSALAALATLRSDVFAGPERMVDLTSVLTLARSGGTPSRRRQDFYGGEIPWLKSGEVANPRIVATQERVTEKGLVGSSAWLVPRNTVVVAMYGATAAEVGYLAVPMATNQAVLALVTKEAVAYSRFLYHLMCYLSPNLKKAASGAAQPNLSKATILREAKFPAVPLRRQHESASVLDAALDVVTTLTNEVHALRWLRASLVNALVSAGVTIPASYDDVLDVS